VLIRPNSLQVGDTIGIVSPASPVAAICPRRTERGIKELARLGFKVKVGRHALKINGHVAGTIKERVEDIHDMFRDGDVKAIMSTIGGFNSHQLLDELDYELIKNNPKILIGYSDITALLTGIHIKTGLVTFLGPALLPQLGEYDGVHSYTLMYFMKALMDETPIGEIVASKEWTEELLWWDKEDNRKRKFISNHGIKTIKPGKARGKVIAGNMGTLLLLAGTEFFPEFENSMLFIEDDPEELPATIDRYLIQFRHLGVFNKITGLVFGRFHSNVKFQEEYPLEEIIKVATRDYDFPIVIDVDFGHTDPMITLPNGVLAQINATDVGCFISINENSTSKRRMS
jgi:muramoyltetrapeptide carboxypeptidase